MPIAVPQPFAAMYGRRWRHFKISSKLQRYGLSSAGGPSLSGSTALAGVASPAGLERSAATSNGSREGPSPGFRRHAEASDSRQCEGGLPMMHRLFAIMRNDAHISD
jgi:hypothetical protein